MPAWIVMRMVIIGPSPAAIPASPASIPATVPTAIPAAPAPVPSIIGPTPAPSVGIIAPVPPQTVGERRESIGIQSVSINVPIPRIQSIDYIPIQRTTDADGIARIAETNDAHSVFIIVFRTIEAVYPFTVGIGHCLFFDIKSILILRKVIFFRVITKNLYRQQVSAFLQLLRSQELFVPSLPLLSRSSVQPSPSRVHNRGRHLHSVPRVSTGGTGLKVIKKQSFSYICQFIIYKHLISV